MKAVSLLLSVVFVVMGVSTVSAETPMRVKNLVFETAGDDCYADGSLVLEGECYALVWKKEGTEFPDLSANPPNPMVPNENFWVAHYFPAAVRYSWIDQASGETIWSACCPETSLAKEGLVIGLNSERNGRWSIFLLDTRYVKEDGTITCGVDPATGLPRCINAYIPVDGLVDFKIGEESAQLPTGPSDSYKQGGDFENYTPIYANRNTVLPSDCPIPQFTAITNAGANVTLTVTNTAPYLTYGISMTNDLSKIHSTTNFVGEAKQGVGAGALTWEIPVGANPAGFFKVLPKPVFGN